MVAYGGLRVGLSGGLLGEGGEVWENEGVGVYERTKESRRMESEVENFGSKGGF